MSTDHTDEDDDESPTEWELKAERAWIKEERKRRNEVSMQPIPEEEEIDEFSKKKEPVLSKRTESLIKKQIRQRLDPLTKIKEELKEKLEKLDETKGSDEEIKELLRNYDAISKETNELKSDIKKYPKSPKSPKSPRKIKAKEKSDFIVQFMQDEMRRMDEEYSRLKQEYKKKKEKLEEKQKNLHEERENISDQPQTLENSGSSWKNYLISCIIIVIFIIYLYLA